MIAEPKGGGLLAREQAAFISLTLAFAIMATASRMPALIWSPLFLLATCIWTALWFTHVLSVPHLTIVAVLTVTVFQDVVLGLFGGRDSTRTGALIFVAFTTALPAFLAVWHTIAVRRLRLWRGNLLNLHALAAAYVLVILLSATVGRHPVNAIIPAMRNALALLVMFYFGLSVPSLTLHRFRRVLLGFGALTVCVLTFGYFERFVARDALWIDVLNLDRIAGFKNLTLTGVVPEPLPADYYSPIGGEYYRRMASLFATPISMGYYLAFVLLFALGFAFPLRRSSWTLPRVGLVFFSGLTLSLTLVKGAYGIVGLGALAVIAVALGRRFDWSFRRIFLGWTIVAVPCMVIGILLFPRSTALLHVYGLVATVQSLSGTSLFIGNGIGSGGTISARLGADVRVSEATGAESGIGTLLYQTGIGGTCLYLFFSLLLLKRLYQLYRAEELPRTIRLGALGVAGGLFGLLGAVFLQENALAPVPIAPYYIFAGALLNVAGRYREELPEDATQPWRR